MDYRDCLKYLDSLGQEMHGLHWELETIVKVLAGLGNPHLKYPTAIVAGTNGKGSKISERTVQKTAIRAICRHERTVPTSSMGNT